MVQHKSYNVSASIVGGVKGGANYVLRLTGAPWCVKDAHKHISTPALSIMMKAHFH